MGGDGRAKKGGRKREGRMKDGEREGRGRGEDKGHRCNELQGTGLDPEE